MSGSSVEKPTGLQVVKLSQNPGQRYELDVEALSSVLLRPDVRHLPVVVVSVAGEYRGGKSFILDFFLRYLQAPRVNQLNKEWLGGEDELLEGFDWRGGGESNTKGIHLWPEPIIVTIEQTGEKVAILLMDTQGTFDTESDMGDNSTIFALSTLLSSVQIYNLRANIGEDDLQHLQLFTEYGRLVCGEEQKAFQTLKFLVRDWMSPYEHAYGYSGGQALLKKRLQTKSNQKKQLQEVRDHIDSCFEKLECFLMPHPGLAVADPNFRGRLSDIREEFRMALLELVPSLFDTKNLTPKIINGDKVQAQGLLEYFKQYIDVFNSDDLPEATTLFQATADACMMAALREARGCYESKMESNIIDDQSVSTAMVQEWHNEAIAAAIEYFKGKKKLGSQENVENHLESFKKELEARLSLFLWQNDAKVRNTVSLAKKAYEDAMGAVCEVQARLCLHERDLQALHQQALADALLVYQQARTQVPPEEDEERAGLIQNLEQYYQHLCIVNEQNNRAATLEAREIYMSRMKDELTRTGVSSDVLNAQHDKALAEALNHFHSHRNRPTEEPEDSHLEHLKQDITVYYEDFKKSNFNSNMWAIQVAQYTYNNHVSSAWGPQSCCFHPRALENLHEKAREHAIEQFLTDRIESEQDDFKEQLIEKLETRFEELKKINTFNNEQTVEMCFAEYTRRMDKHSQPALVSFFIAPFVIKLFGLLPRYHDSSKRKVLSMFSERRRGRSYDDDEYLENLKKKIEEAFRLYRDPLLALIRELGLHHILPNVGP